MLIFKPKIRLANINELGDWKVGDYINDFKEPTGEHFVYQVICGDFSNSATAGSGLRVVVRLSRNESVKGKVIANIEYDEYNNGTIDERGISSAKIVCNATRMVYAGNDNWGYYDKEIGYQAKSKNLDFAELLRLEQTLEFTDRFGGYTTTVYNFTINCQYLNNALIKTGILGIDEVH